MAGKKNILRDKNKPLAPGQQCNYHGRSEFLKGCRFFFFTNHGPRVSRDHMIVLRPQARVVEEEKGKNDQNTTEFGGTNSSRVILSEEDRKTPT